MADAHPTAARFVPDTGDLAALARAALGCRGCDLYEHATQTAQGADRDEAYAGFVKDLQVAAALLS